MTIWLWGIQSGLNPTKITQPCPQVLSVNASAICSFAGLTSSVRYGKILPNLFNNSWWFKTYSNECVGYEMVDSHLIFNRRKWSNCFIKNVPKISRILPNFQGSFENEALENEDRSTKHPNLENEAPKSRKWSTQDSKTKHPNLENEAPNNRKRSTQNSKAMHPKLETCLSFNNTRQSLVKSPAAGIKHDNE